MTATIHFYIFYSVQSHLSLLLHQSPNRISLLNLLNCLKLDHCIIACLCGGPHTKKVKAATYCVQAKRTERAVAGGPDSHHMWLPLPGQPLWWGSWRFSHRVRKAHEPPVGIHHPSVGFSLKGQRQRNTDHICTRSQELKKQNFSWRNHNVSYDSPPDACTI